MNIFISYARADERWRKKIVQTLRPLVRDGKIKTIWDETDIVAGADRQDSIDNAIATADAALLLLSPAFCASDECMEKELPRLRDRGIAIVPVLVSPCVWADIEALTNLEIFPRDHRALDGRKDGNQQLVALVKELVRSHRAAPPEHSNAPRVSVARLPRTAGRLFGRDQEIAALDAAWADPNTCVAALVAWGGGGKTALVNHWLARHAPAYSGAERVFAWSFYSQGSRPGAPASSDEFLDEGLRFFGDRNPGSGSAWDRASRLAVAIRRRRTIVVLDGIEPLQDPLDGTLRDPGLAAIVGELAASMNGLCIVTTRPPFRELDRFPSTARVIDLSKLEPAAGAALLASRGVQGEQAELESASVDYHGHGLALSLLGSYIADALGGDVRRRQEVKLLDEGVAGVRHARSVMRSYEVMFGRGLLRELLYVAGLFDRPADIACVRALRESLPIRGVTEALVAATEAKLNQSLTTLRRSGLLLDAGDISIDAHPLVREYFADRLEAEDPMAFRAAHGRVYEHLQTVAPQLPSTLTEMQPLFQSIRHGCRASRRVHAFGDVFMRRIRRGDAHYSFNVLGAVAADLAALWEFFDGDWTRPHADFFGTADSLLLNEAGHGLFALGRTREAIPCFEKSLAIRVAQQQWRAASTPAAHLAETLAIHGELGRALQAARQAAEIAERSGDIDDRPMNHSLNGWVLHLAGDMAGAERSFLLAERIQMEGTVFSPRLYSIAGAQFCQLLLDAGRAQEAIARAEASIRHLSRPALRKGGRHLLSDGLDYLTIARGHEMRGERTLARSEFARSLDALRGAGRLYYLAVGLLASAAFYRTENPKRSEKELTSAFDISVRSEYSLLECDCHLFKASLAIDRTEHAMARTAYEQARRIATDSGYGRVRQDLARLERLIQ